MQEWWDIFFYLTSESPTAPRLHPHYTSVVVEVVVVAFITPVWHREVNKASLRNCCLSKLVKMASSAKDLCVGRGHHIMMDLCHTCHATLFYEVHRLTLRCIKMRYVPKRLINVTPLRITRHIHALQYASWHSKILRNS